MWFVLTTHFGMRARQEHHTLSMENFRVDVSDDNKIFIEFHEDPTKTRGSGLRPTERSAVPKMFATGGVRCPVRLFQLYMSKRPDDLEMTGPFYLSSKHWSSRDEKVWFTKQPVGKNTISGFMKQIIKGTSAETNGKKITNHSGRKTCVKKLKRAQVPEESIIKVTGHKTAKGLRAYDEGDHIELQAMSNILSNEPSTSTSKAPPPPPPAFRALTQNLLNNGTQFNQTQQSTEQSGFGAYTFNNCNVTFNIAPKTDGPTKRKRMIIYSDSESSQEL